METVRRITVKEINIDNVRDILGFPVSLPKKLDFEADAEPRIFLHEACPHAFLGLEGGQECDRRKLCGAAIGINYSNGFEFLVEIRHPKDKKKALERAFRLRRESLRIAAEAEFSEPELWHLATVGRFMAVECEHGRVVTGRPECDTSKAMGPTIIWYDRRNWAEYIASGPPDSPLVELRAVANSIY